MFGGGLAWYLVLPLALHSDRAWALMLVPLVLATNTLWSLIHEAIHGLLFTQRRSNDWSGRLLAIVFGAPFRVLRVGHLLHHRYSRSPRERTEVYEPATTRWLTAACAYYPRLCGGMYLLELAAVPLALIPARLLPAIERRLTSDAGVAHLLIRALRQRQALAEVRIDAIIIMVLMTGSLILYGEHWWMLACALAGRAFLVSFADNAYHYATRLDAPKEARNVRAPRWLECVLLNFPLHGVHHRHPGLPWHALRRRFEADGGRYDAAYFVCLTRQLRGPIAASALAAQLGR